MKRSFTIATVIGVPIRIHLSWFIVLGLIVYILATQLDILLPHWNRWAIWVLSSVTTLTFFMCLTGHELAHSWAAQKYNIRVHGITLFILGGVSEIEDNFDAPKTELIVAAVGPIISLVLFGLFLIISILIYQVSEGLHLATSILAYANLGLSLYNLIPAPPLDGGRMLKATIWIFTGRFEQASKLTTVCGIFIATAMSIGCILLIILTSHLIVGLWLIGLSLYLLYHGFTTLVSHDGPYQIRPSL